MLLVVNVATAARWAIFHANAYTLNIKTNETEFDEMYVELVIIINVHINRNTANKIRMY